MGYSTSKKALERVKPILDALLAAETNIELEFKDPHTVMYWIRDGLAVASRMKDSPYTEIKNKFILRAKSDRIVAELRRKEVEFSAAILAAKLKILTIKNVSEVMEVVGAAIKHKAPRMEFPDAHLTGNGVLNLKLWCEKNNYSVTQSEPFLIIEKIDAGTDSQKDGGVEL